MTDNFKNTATMKEKAQIAQNDRWNTNYGRAMAEMEQIAGRFAARQKAQVIGQNAPTYPQAADWTHDHTGDEPSFGVDVGAAPVVGEKFEVDASIARIKANSNGVSNDAVGKGDPPPLVSQPNVEGGSLTPTHRRLLRRR